MEPIPTLFFQIALVGFAAGSLAAHRTRQPAMAMWSLGWALNLLALVILQTVPESPARLAGVSLASALFSPLMLAGALAIRERARPAWLLPVAVGIAAGRAAAVLTGVPELGSGLAFLFEPLYLGAAALVLWRADGFALRLLAPLLAVTAGVALLDSVQEIQGSFSLWPWLLVAPPLVVGQLHASALHMRQRIADSQAAADRAESARDESLRRFHAIAETADDVIAEADESGRLTYISPGVSAVLGYSPAELAGRPVREILEPVAEVGREPPANTGETGMRPLRIRHRDGSTRWLETTERSYRSATGNRRVILARDVTRRIEMEERLRQTQKLESLGMLAGGIAHDFNNLLVGILGNVGVLREELPAPGTAGPVVDDIERAAERAAMLTHQLLTYAGNRRFQTEAVDVEPLLRETVRLVERRIPTRVGLRFDFADELLPLEGNATELGQVVMNLVTNAAEAVGDGPGAITLTARLDEIGADDPRNALHELSPGYFVRVEVCDTGTGMDPATRARVFDPFFTTKGPGRGLGLAATLGIVRSHGGALELASEPGEGSRFRIWLPTSREVPRRDSGPGDSEPGWQSDAAILLVDDEDAVLRTAGRALRRCGVEVLCASHGRAALDCLRARPDVAAVVLDLRMPRMSGEEALPAIRALRPQLPVVISTAFADASEEAWRSHPDVAALLPKPYRAESLIETLRQIVEPGHARVAAS